MEPAGLTSEVATFRLAMEGPNLLPAPAPPHPLRRLGAQMTHFFARMLWVAAVLAVIAGMPALGIAIAVVVLVNGVFAFAQEARAEHAAQALRDLLPRRAIVLRDRHPIEVDASELVRGDLVLLVAGDRICADLRVVQATGLRIDTSMMTGESVPIAAGAHDALYGGTFVVEGEATAEVVATGAATVLAGIAGLSRRAVRPPSPLAVELGRVVRTISQVAVAVGVAFVGLSLLLGTPPSDGFLFAVGVTVALVPERLLPTVTLSLAVGAQRMARQEALVRHLESVETLGSTTFICTDKTGTLTTNEMSVVAAWTPHGTAEIHGDGYAPDGEVEVADAARGALVALARAGARCSTGRTREVDGRWIAVGDPMEAALDALARRVGVERTADEAACPERGRVPFDPQRRMMSVVVGDTLLVKGAPDAVLPPSHCAGRRRRVVAA